jgi:muramidase (phage lysozyme)
LARSVGGNRGAFLDLISYSEGTSNITGSDDGYLVEVSGTLFHDYYDHPRKLIQLNPNLKSTAAGRYQLLAKYFDYYKKLLNLPDFSPDSQDKIAIQQIKECHALDDVDAGRIQIAINKCARIWASFPGNHYGQRQVGMDDLIAAYVNAGGVVA